MALSGSYVDFERLFKDTYNGHSCNSVGICKTVVSAAVYFIEDTGMLKFSITIRPLTFSLRPDNSLSVEIFDILIDESQS